MTTKALTLRLPPDLYASGQRVAQERQISLNALLQESLAATVRAKQQRKLFEAFTRLGEDADACAVDYAFPAAAEVVLADASPQKEVTA